MLSRKLTTEPCEHATIAPNGPMTRAVEIRAMEKSCENIDFHRVSSHDTRYEMFLDLAGTWRLGTVVQGDYLVLHIWIHQKIYPNVPRTVSVEKYCAG